MHCPEARPKMSPCGEAIAYQSTKFKDPTASQPHSWIKVFESPAMPGKGASLAGGLQIVAREPRSPTPSTIMTSLGRARYLGTIKGETTHLLPGCFPTIALRTLVQEGPSIAYMKLRSISRGKCRLKVLLFSSALRILVPANHLGLLRPANSVKTRRSDRQ
jgi:hypothetical protein